MLAHFPFRRPRTLTQKLTTSRAAIVWQNQSHHHSWTNNISLSAYIYIHNIYIYTYIHISYILTYQILSSGIRKRLANIEIPYLLRCGYPTVSPLYPTIAMLFVGLPEGKHTKSY